MPPESKVSLPLPSLQRWQPLRLGVVNLFHYDCEEFCFCDGHLLLRGNNGTGKSKVLSLTLPFLFDANCDRHALNLMAIPARRWHGTCSWVSTTAESVIPGLNLAVLTRTVSIDT